MTRTIRFGAALGVVAAGPMATTPAVAADLPTIVSPAPVEYAFGQFDGEAENADHHRWRRWHHRRNRIGVGDVLAGALVIGGIAAIASAASNNNRRNDRYRDRDYDRRDDQRRYDQQRNPRSTGSRGLDNAVSQCVSEIERDVRIDSVDGVDRTAEGWRVTGSLFNGSGFVCSIGNNGRINAIDYGGFSGASASRSDNQWSDADYLQARQSINGTANQSLPDYPGGPIPGEDYGAIDEDLGG